MYSPGIQTQYCSWGVQTNNYTDAALAAVATGGTIVAAVSGQIIVIVALYGNGSASQTVTLVSNAVSITGAMNSSTTLPIIMPFNPAGWCKSSSGNAITATITSGTFSGAVSYFSYVP